MNAFKSFKHPIAIDLGTRSLSIERDYEQHVVQLIKQVLFTNPGERVNLPDFGCGLRQLIFAPNSDVAASIAQVKVYQALDKWLSSVMDVDAVEIKSSNEKLYINIAYYLKTSVDKKTLNVEVS
ncbi:GPW/gp25 family protein [Pleionea litopenaei]|uniref:GPW/gp25 family protein n=1 Tax=Pleionea litopenaei TaxID=3070815 RepID=A0AA51RUN1_9GAMM|nr:GPW/gp25 family protein [Pleionea sp. HL-JVS1]WMS87814.1 GPW/gp25 family protein [Pleionea sp. HL-JVS1]